MRRSVHNNEGQQGEHWTASITQNQSRPLPNWDLEEQDNSDITASEAVPMGKGRKGRTEKDPSRHGHEPTPSSRLTDCEERLSEQERDWTILHISEAKS